MVTTKMITRATCSTGTTITRARRSDRLVTRSFSGSTSCLAYFPPPFEATQSAELDDILHTIRQRVLLPRHLKGTTRRLVSNPQSSKQLELDDIRTQIGDQEERLVPHNYGKDGVSWRGTFQRVLELTTETKDFSIWPELLKGYDGAHYKLKRTQHEKLVRKMCLTGNLHTLLDLLDTASHWKTPAPPLVITLVPHAIRNQALSADYVVAARHVISEDDVETWSKFIDTIGQGTSIKESLSLSPELAQAQRKSLRKGLSRSIRLNLALGRPQAHHKLLDEFFALNEVQDASNPVKHDRIAITKQRATVLNDPILAAVPLEMQSRLESLEAVSPGATTKSQKITESADSPVVKPVSSMTAAQYAERLLSTLEQQPISTKTAPLSPDTTNSSTNILQTRQAIWLQRALCVAASLGAAADATTVKQDKRLSGAVAKQQEDINAALISFVEFVEQQQASSAATTTATAEAAAAPSKALVTPYMLDQYRRYVDGQEWGMFGGFIYQSSS